MLHDSDLGVIWFQGKAWKKVLFGEGKEGFHGKLFFQFFAHFVPRKTSFFF